MNLTRIARGFGERLFRRSVDLTFYSSLLGLFSFLSASRTLGKTLRTKNGCKCVTMKPRKLMIVGASLFSFGVLGLAVIFPPFFRSQVKKQVALKDGAEMRDLWSNLPIPLDFKIYLFNVTNPVEITAGQKPVVEEVGPYFYDEYKQKVDLVDREEDDSLEYGVKTTWYFNPSKSNGLTGDEELVVPNILILSMVKITLVEQPSAMGIINKAVDSIFKKPSTVFIRTTAKKFLFDGFTVDCSVKDFAGSAACNVLKEKASDLLPDPENEGHYLFSLFGAKNGSTAPQRIRVLRGIKNYKDVGRVTEFDGKPKLDIYSGDECNEFNGTDSTIFPPLMTEQDDIVSFAADICRSVSAHFVNRTKVQGVKTFHFKADYGDMSTNPSEKCFCPAPDACLGKNLMDLTKCVGAPLIGSLPHLLESEEKYHQMIDGLKPNDFEHGVHMDFEPITATPVEAHKRLQFNMFLHSVEKFKLMKNFPECLFPLFWVEEGILLDGKLLKKLKMALMAKSTVGFLKYMFILAGIGTGAYGAVMHYKQKGTNTMDVTKVAPQSQGAKEGDEKKWPTQMNISTIQSAAVPPNLDN